MDWRISDFMKRRVFTVPPGMLVADLTRALVERRFTGAPVVDASGRLVGIVSLVDVAVEGAFHPRELERRTVADIMSHSVVQVSMDAPVREAVELFRQFRVHRLPVTDRGQLVGILSPVDLFDAVLEKTRRQVRL